MAIHNSMRFLCMIFGACHKRDKRKDGSACGTLLKPCLLHNVELGEDSTMQASTHHSHFSTVRYHKGLHSIKTVLSTTEQ